MQYEEFVTSVEERIRADTRDEAVAAIRATLETLSERLAGSGARARATKLPSAISDFFRHIWNGQGEQFDLQEFYRRVGVREHVPQPKATYHARCVISVLQASVAPSEIEALRRQLPPDFEGLFDAPRESDGTDAPSRIADVETKHPEVIGPDATVMEAAQKMKALDIGALPVCDDSQMLGMVTDRDITIRATAAGRDPATTKVREVMTEEVVFCYEDQKIEEAAAIMESKQVRRLPVINRDNCLVGMVSLGDLAVRNRNDKLSGEVLERVSEHAELVEQS